MAATKRNAGLTSAVPRATLNDEELVCMLSSKRGCCIWVKYCVIVDNARVLPKIAYVLLRTCDIRNCFLLKKKGEKQEKIPISTSEIKFLFDTNQIY